MNCPNCGAHNDADARFCGECGNPLENPDVEATIIGQKFEMPDDLDFDDNDMTIMSSSARLAEEAKTLAVDQEAIAAAGTDFTRPDEPEPLPSLTDSARAAMLPPSPPSVEEPSGVGRDPAAAGAGVSSNEPPPAVGGTGTGGGNTKKILMTVGGILLFIVILCCCCSMAMVASVLSDPNAIEDILREVGSLGLQNPIQLL